MGRRITLILGLAAVLVGACSTPAGTPGPTITPATAAPQTAAPMTDAPATAAPTTAADVTIEATAVGDAGTILVDAETGLTLYLFTMDVQGSGESACTGGCLEAWPALTVAAGETPTGGPGVDPAKLGTITRADNGEIQVTYDGLPLYFFQNDEEPGDLNGVYENWETVAP
jgi:predicted lipoprotein with Yx(FWY)xxD motif